MNGKEEEGKDVKMPGAALVVGTSIFLQVPAAAATSAVAQHLAVQGRTFGSPTSYPFSDPFCVNC